MVVRIFLFFGVVSTKFYFFCHIWATNSLFYLKPGQSSVNGRIAIEEQADYPVQTSSRVR